MELTWTRRKADTTYIMGGHPHTMTHTTHSAALSNGEQVRITSVEGSFFVDIDGERAGGLPYPTLRDAKAAVQRREDVTA